MDDLFTRISKVVINYKHDKVVRDCRKALVEGYAREGKTARKLPCSPSSFCTTYLL